MVLPYIHKYFSVILFSKMVHLLWTFCRSKYCKKKDSPAERNYLWLLLYILSFLSDSVDCNLRFIFLENCDNVGGLVANGTTRSGHKTSDNVMTYYKKNKTVDTGQLTLWGRQTPSYSYLKHLVFKDVLFFKNCAPRSVLITAILFVFTVISLISTKKLT